MAYIGVVPEDVEGSLVERGRETTESVLVNVLRGLRQNAEAVLEDGKGAGVLELDNVLVGDESIGVTADDERRGSFALGGRRGKDRGQKSEEDRQTHDEDES